jgi:rubrerythrin
MNKRSFASLTIQEGLHVAMQIEARNARIYEQFAELFRSFPDVDSQTIAAVFSEMAGEEYAHGSELHARYTAHFGDAPCNVRVDDIEDLVELPRVPDGSIFAIARSGAATVPPIQAFAIALAAEEGAVRFYGRLAGTTEDPELSFFYQELGHFEAEHVGELRQRIELARGSVNGEIT